MKTLFLSLFLICTFTLVAAENPFLGREFWKTNPTPEEVQDQIDAGHSPSEFNVFNFDAVVYAILEKASFPTLKFLLEQPGNSAKKITHDGRNYLMWAGYKGNEKLINYLIEAGSDMELRDDKGNNVVTFTAIGGTLNPKIYELYEKAGLPVSTPNRNGATALHFLVQHVDHLSDLNYFLEKGLEIDQKDSDNNTLFHYAAAQGKTPIIEELIEKGLDPKAVNDLHENALFFVAKGMRGIHHSAETFKYFVELGLDPSVKNKSKNTLLHLVAGNNKNPNVFSFLLEQGISPQAKNNIGNKALNIAILRGNPVAIELLYSITEDKNALNKEGKTALTYALQTKNQQLVEKLIKNGADVTILSDNGMNLITVLVATYTDKDQAFFNKYLNQFLKKGVKIQDQTVHLATLKESEYLIHRLLKEGKDINVKNKDELSPIQISAMKGKNTKFMRFLIENGADKSIKTAFGESVYELAQQNELLKENIEFLR